LLAGFLLLALLAPWIAPYSYEAQDLANVLAPPSAAHWFGTDDLGRDILSRLIWGARPSMAVGVVGVGLGAIVGLPFGLLAGFRGGWLDRLIMALVEVVLTFPSIVLSIAIVAVIGAGTGSVIIAIAVTTAPAIAVIARATTLSERAQDYVQAARALGAADGRIMLRHVLRNIFPPVLTETTLRISQAILVAAALGFLGLGVQPPLPEWGTMLSQGRNYLAVAPHMTYFSGLFIALLVLGFNLAGDTLRDMYDPRLKDV
jgi:ABC-type dipeptide/oligopeptide/nickel transport system permease subunit